ncbi:MAG: hypothetical protein OEW45_09915 [Deltaproteobacteria bacterium]|nr:hypothetical protein [Deltaproteobacteria bacterium]
MEAGIGEEGPGISTVRRNKWPLALDGKHSKGREIFYARPKVQTAWSVCGYVEGIHGKCRTAI